MKFLVFTYLLYTLFFFASFASSKAWGQSYGLGFYGQEVVQDQRTGLELGYENPLCVKERFKLSFEFSFLPNRADYFGYLVRIIDSDGNNIDLIYDRHDETNKHFRLIKGDTLSSITFNLDTSQLYGPWTTLTFALSADGKQLHFSDEKNQFTEPVSMNGSGCFRLFFGRNNFETFKTTDVPAMKIRNIKLFDGEKLAYHWPLDQSAGLRVSETAQKLSGRVTNPMWLKKKYMEWELLHTHSIRGEASVAFDPVDEQVYIVGADTLLRYSVPTREATLVGYLSGTQYLVNGSQSVYDTSSDQLLNFSIDQRTVAAFDPQQLTWDRNFTHPAPGTNFLHLNKFYSAADSSIYFIGGYGHYRYKDSVFQYHVPSNSWTYFRPGGDEFIPRYLAGIGSTETGAYLVGGYGSSSGQQILNPKNLYDFLYFDLEKKTFEKKFELDIEKEDFVFANSLVIDQPGNSWYGLIFPKHKFNSSLQLIHGSLTDSTFTLAGNSIPYQFDDVHSFADLFYCTKSKRFIAVTIFRDNTGVAHVKLYSLFSPPLAPNAATSTLGNSSTRIIWLAGVALLCLLCLFFIHQAKKRRAKRGVDGGTRQGRQGRQGTTAPLLAHSSSRQEYDEKIAPDRNAIYLFGGMQLVGREGQDITGQLSPLLTELFLILLLHTVKGGKGVTSARLTELLWYDKPKGSARNNRAVNIAKLKSIIQEMGDTSSIYNEGGYWKLHLDKQQVYIDYRDYLDITGTPHPLNKDQITSLTQIVTRGNFLPEADYDWLDPFKAELYNEITDTFTQFARTAPANEAPEFLIKIANYISRFDALNEDAMIIKCNALVRMGKHSLATQAFDHFCKRYRKIYGEAFKHDYKSIIK